MGKLQVTAPYDGALIHELDYNSVADVDRMLETAAGLARNHDARIPQPRRIEILEKTADLVESRIEDLTLQAAREGGKPYIDSKVELVRAVQGIRESARALDKLLGREIPMKLNAASANRMAYTLREPIGVVVAVSAFNHPFNLIVHQVCPAVAVGCPVLIKPAATTPLSCVSLLETLYEAGLPEEWAQLVIADNEVSEKMVTDPRVDFFSFIGSARVGWMLRSKLAPGTRCALEHGGAAPVIMEADADLDSALPLLAKGGFYHAGQVCVSVQRVFAHESIAVDVAERLTALANDLVVGDPTSEETEVGPLILEREVDRVDEWVKEAAAGGAKVLTGGEKVGATCYAPTVLVDPAPGARVSTSEIFGPVINVYPYRDRHDAIAHANDVPYSFQAAVFTRDLEAALDTTRRINAAAVMINDHTAFRVDWMPFAGYKQSGLGIGGILPTMEEMTEEKMFVIKSPSL